MWNFTASVVSSKMMVGLGFAGQVGVSIPEPVEFGEREVALKVHDVVVDVQDQTSIVAAVFDAAF
ncbi:MAG: hypothetical protein OXC83_04605 [Chloroflexi bacterium]|nr:hypothetical protein [Chloroflexota bacterium]